MRRLGERDFFAQERVSQITAPLNFSAIRPKRKRVELDLFPLQ